jgi:hypothetical protein
MKKLILIFFLSGCSVEGNSVYLGSGPTKYFLTMKSCEKEALRRFEGGGRVYSGFECREMLFGIFQLDHKRY